MTTWTPKRFWTEATVGEVSGRLTVLLDGRPIRTPSKALLALPSAALAAAVAAEWAAQDETLRPATMPMTRLANTAIDRVTPEFDAVAAIVAAFGETDLLCYRAGAPEELVRRQAEAWDPLLDWAARRHGARLAVTTGILPVGQPEAAIAALAGAVRALSPWELTALHELVSLTGSLVLGLAVAGGACPADAAWTLSRIDEDWQTEQWGADAEAEATAERRRSEYLEAVRFHDLLRGVA
ncbi:MAG: ATPase [Rhodobacteraceae bacterium]|jgi:chaperone required for assembly of F1-ATPase|nr:ATPase [Paracoccaceae bacterium]